MLVTSGGGLKGGGQGVRGYLLCSREGMVETGHISHYGFLIRTTSVHNVYNEGVETVVMKTHTKHILLFNNPKNEKGEGRRGGGMTDLDLTLHQQCD